MKKYEVYWTNPAKRDLIDIIDYIALESATVAEEKFSFIRSACDSLKQFPEQGRVIPELSIQNIKRYREVIVSPWRVMYKIEKEAVFVLAVIDGRRNVEDILLNRQLR